MFRLLTGQTFELETTDDDAASRFITIFRRTWSRLPLAPRHAILRLWRQDGVGVAFWEKLVASGSASACRVTLQEKLDEPTQAGSHFPSSGHLRFSLTLFREMPDGVAETVIAHELAHAFLWATGKGEEYARQTLPDYHTNADSYRDDPEEVEVRRITTAWGFDEPAFDRWLKRRGRRKKANQS